MNLVHERDLERVIMNHFIEFRIVKSSLLYFYIVVFSIKHDVYLVKFLFTD